MRTACFRSRLASACALLLLVPACYLSSGRDAPAPPVAGDAAAPVPVDPVPVDSGRPPIDAGCASPPDDPGARISPLTIDRVETPLSSRAWSYYYPPALGFRLMPSAPHIFHLSDGTTREGGSGGGPASERVSSVERSGTTIRYRFAPSRLTEIRGFPRDLALDFALDAVGEVVLVAELGGTVGTIEGRGRLVHDAADHRDEDFHHASAPPCSIVPFVTTITLESSATFTETLFDGEFEYTIVGSIDFGAASR